MGLGIEMDTGLGTGRGGLSTQLKRLTKFRSMVRFQTSRKWAAVGLTMKALCRTLSWLFGN